MALGKVCSDSDAPCPIFLDLDGVSDRTLASIRTKLEDSNSAKKIAALEQTILHMLKGEDVSSLLMSIIRFVLPSNDHRLKKLVHLFFQIFDFCTADGTVREESILVCNALRNDLCSPNEYVRGSAMRLVSKLRHWNIVGPMLPAIVDNLKHPDPYVHRNALLCLSKIAERFGTECVLSSTEDTERLLLGNSGASVKAQAFNLLRLCDPSLAVQYLLGVEGTMLSFPARFHLEVLSSFFWLYSLDSRVHSLMMRVTLMLMENSPDNDVRMEGAHIICRMKSTPVEARRAAASALIKVLLDESDLNVKMLVIEKLNTLHARSSSLGDVPNVLEEHVMDLVRALSGSSRHITMGLLSLALRSVTRQNADALLQSFKKAFTTAEDIATYSQRQIAQYRITLIKAIHYTCGLYPERSGIVYDMLLGYLSHRHAETAEDCAMFFKQLTELLPQLREETIVKLLTFIDLIPHSSVLSVCFWVIGEYAGSEQLASHCCNKIYELLSPYPFVVATGSDSAAGSLDRAGTSGSIGLGDGQDDSGVATHTVVLQDGTYGAQLSDKKASTPTATTLRDMLVDTCDPLLYCSVAQCLLKLSFACNDTDCIAKATLVVANLVRLVGRPQYASVYSQRRLRTILKLCLGLLKERDKYRPLVQEYISASCRKWSPAQSSMPLEPKSDVDERISYSVLFGEVGEDEWSIEDESEVGGANPGDNYEIDKLLSTGNSIYKVRTKDADKRNLGAVHQFTSLMDALYIETTLNVITTRLYLTLYLRNTTEVILQNIRVELCANDRLEMSSSIPIITLGPGESRVLQVNFKLKRSLNDVIYGHVYFDKEKSGIQECLPFNPMSVCMYDYVQPSFISPSLFRTYWTEFEWEHKIQIHPSKADPLDLLRGLLQVTHMTVVCPAAPPTLKSAPGPAGQAEFLSKYMEYLKVQPELAALLGDTSFFALNLFCSTPHGEEALANLSVVKQKQGLYSGCFKIRSRTESVALSLGDRVSSLQRTFVI
ncbi:coatamer beta subunit, putative [Babesia bigemina]|uniref:Coatomer subunit beta n=1 Tax=Babesia bigemina TaxID=5866 RepID=A0A061D113_BABBI|nr:coatamer beta subunit, putative [Babesia bigemina]CDR94511.1 coatamer beta subunit, putative [Babesia bigemina]|eukprot:XP_012766697.1 coatamer beta subunit, putative [Babesia bigemina]